MVHGSTRESADDSVDSEFDMAEYKKLRGIIKGRLTLFEKYVSKFEGEVTGKQRVELELRVESAKDILQSFSSLQDKIESNSSDEDDLSCQLEYRQAFEDQYFNIMAIAKLHLNNSEADSKFTPHSKHSLSVKMKLPEIRLPAFDGSFDNWLEFRNSYHSMIHKRADLDSIQKFHYLKAALSGSALQVISSLEFTAPNYSHAWDLLENRYHNNRLLIHNHVKSLFAAQSISKESPILIRKLVDSILRNLRALKSLGEPTEGWDTLINYIIVSKLDPTTEREWENHKGSFLSDSASRHIRLEDLLNFLKNRADMLDMIHNNNNKSSTQSNKSLTTSSKSKAQPSHSLVSTHNSGNTKSSLRPCAMCKAKHPLYTCVNFLNLSVKERTKIVEDNKLCKNCLRAAHNISECVYGSCKRCDEKHNSLLHIDSGKSEAAAPTSLVATAYHSNEVEQVSVSSCTVNSLHSTGTTPVSRVLLATALVEVMDSNGQYQPARVVLDSASENSFVSEKLINRLNVKVIQSTLSISGVGCRVSHSYRSCDIHMRSKANKYHNMINCFVLPNIVGNVPSRPYDFDAACIPRNLTLADPSFNEPGEVDLLLGGGVFWELLGKERIRLSNGAFLINTKLGWSSPIDSQLRQFWELEEVSRPDTILTEDERWCEEYFATTTTRDEHGRFSVRIPLKEPTDSLGESYGMAKNRLLSLERKFERLSSYKQMYSDFMREYEDLGHMTLVEDDHSKPCYYLPHHGVLREHSTTTKLRVVFDASAATSSGRSLNDIQHAGPPLQNDIFSILLRFRQHRYVACADVEKMFRQALIQPDQRRLQLILWRQDPSQPIRTYRLNTVTYGMASAPYLSMRCLKQLAAETTDDVIANVINDDFFVDDLITGHDDQSTLTTVCQKVAQVLNSGCFPLRKWTFSHDVNTTVSKALSSGDHCQNKTLGLGWRVDRDELHFTSNVNNQSPVTKRGIMSIISQIYDPLGLLAPTIIVAKIILQRLWLAKVDWDEPVPPELAEQWSIFMKELEQLGSLRAPRCVMSEGAHRRELHVFSDASQEAYGACAYVRTCTDNSSVTVRLLCSKSKVAPVKTVCTIPRLELCGALLGARLYRKIKTALKVTFDKIVFWTDSTIVLGWLRMSPHLLKTFVQNRVSEINEITGDAVWAHVGGADNPADVVSRGLHLGQLKCDDSWWHGPPFLREAEVTNSSSFEAPERALPEVKASGVSAVMCSDTQHSDLIDFDRFSSFNRLRRTTAYVLRFISNARANRHQRQTGPLAADEIENATLVLAKIAQRQSFPEECRNLDRNLGIKAKRIIGLNVFLDQRGLIRVGGRIGNSPNFNDNKKHPILLCGKHRFTGLLFSYEHARLLHGGPQLLLCSVRDAWWPLRGRDLARSTVRDCVRCARFRGNTLSPMMGSLPAQRLEPGYPFMRCGVDYAGPVMLLNRKGRGAALQKGYICLFICMSIRAVHLELATSLSTDDYILALKRFISRRGKPAEIFSDNGKNFTGAKRELCPMFDKPRDPVVVNYASNNSIKFTFIPPYCPHFGGLWEAGVKSCKYHLRRVIGLANLTYEELSTVLAQIEAVLNSRPISAMSSDPSDLTALTPAHFLIGRPLTAPAATDGSPLPPLRRTRYGLVEQMRRDLWKRWAKEYVSELQTRTRWHLNKGDVKLDTLVLVKDDNIHPLNWKLGRIVRIYPGQDKISRVADIRTASGTVRRGFSKICPLPVQPVEPADEAPSCSCLGTY